MKYHKLWLFFSMPLSQLKTHLLIDFDEIYSATGFAPSYTHFPSYIAPMADNGCCAVSREKRRSLSS